jgi:hypothetical protein
MLKWKLEMVNEAEAVGTDPQGLKYKAFRPMVSAHLCSYIITLSIQPQCRILVPSFETCLLSSISH